MALPPSSDDLESWLAENPVEWAQVLSARVGLRVLPVAIGLRADEDWLGSFAIALLRAAATSWILRFLTTQAGEGALSDAASRAAADAAFVARAAARAADRTEQSVVRAADTIANATDAARADAYPDFAARAAWQAIGDADGAATLLDSVHKDREWLLLTSTTEHFTTQITAERLTRTALWLPVNSLPIHHQLPEWFSREWQGAGLRLVESHATYRVWIDWYDRIIAGHQPAFGNTAETEEYVASKILTVDHGFWRQRPAIVNETILKWISQVELREELLSLIDQSRSNQPSLPVARAEIDLRTDLLRQLELLARVEPPSHGAIGHNRPPEPVQWRTEILLLAEIVEQAASAVAELRKPEPDRSAVGERVSSIGLALDRLVEFAGVAGEKSSAALAIATGAAAGLAIASTATFVWDDLLAAALKWLTVFL